MNFILKKAFVTLTIFCVFEIAAYAQFLGKSKKGEITKEQKEQAEYVFADGMKEYILDNYSKALEGFEKSISIDKSNAAAYYMIGQIYVKQNNLYKAIEFAKKAIELNDTNKYYYLLLANIYERKQDFAEATKVYLALFKNLPNSTEHYYDLAPVYLQQGKYEDAIKCYDKIEKAFGISEDISLQKQQWYLKQGKLNEAVNEGKKLVEAFPDDVRYLLVLVELLITNEKYEEAEKLVSNLVKKEPNNPSANLALFQIYNAKGENLKANERLRAAFKNSELDADTKIGILISKIRQIQGDEAIKELCLELGAILVEVHPTEAKAYAINADILVISTKNAEALANYLKSNALDNSHNKIWQQILTLDLELNMIDSLVMHSDKALELFPNQSVFWLYNGLAHQFKKNYKKAIVSFEQGKKLAFNDKNSLIQFNTSLGDSYHGLKDYNKSDQCFDEVLNLDENNYVVLNNYSYYLSLRKEKLEQAKKMSERVIKEFPTNATYIDTYAWILYVMKDYAKAKDFFEQIVVNQSNGTIVEHYGDVLYQLGDKDKALQQWKLAKTLGESSDFIDKKIADKKLYE
ncbi:MAG: tetratricopeptide repeat protein [Cytophagales bacterium]